MHNNLFIFSIVRCLSLTGLLSVALNVNAGGAALDVMVSGYRGYLTDDHPVRMGLKYFAEQVNSQPGAGLNIVVSLPHDPHPGKQIEALSSPAWPPSGINSAPPIMVQSVTGLAYLDKYFQLFDTPFAAENNAQIDALLDGEFGDAMLKRLDDVGLIGLSYWENGFHQITNNIKPITRFSDLNGIKMRVIPEPFFEIAMSALGMTTVPMFFSGVYDALKEGKADAQENYYAQIVAGHLYDVQRFLTVTNHAYGAMALVVNKAFWLQLTEYQQQVLKTAATKAALYQRSVNRKQQQNYRDFIAAKGMRINILEDKERDKMRLAIRSVYPVLFADLQGPAMDLFEKELMRIENLK